MKTFACFAATLDGKIAAANEPGARVGSRRDLEHLKNVRNRAQAILCGGETFRKFPKPRHGSTQTLSEQFPLQCVLTRKASHLPPDAPLFSQAPAGSIIVFSPEEPDADIQALYPAHVRWIATGNDNPAPVIVETLGADGIDELMVEGGGHVMQLFLVARLLDELYLTICPLLLGGINDPTLVTGPGFKVSEAPRTEIIDCERIENELYLHLALTYPG